MATRNLTGPEIMNLGGALQALMATDIKGSVRFNYAATRTKKVVQPEIDSMKENAQPSEPFREYDKLRVDLCKEFCSKDQAGNPVQKEGGDFVFEDAGREKFEAAMVVLKEEHKEALKGEMVHREELNRVFSEPKEITIYEVALEEFPELPLNMFDALSPMIKED